MKSIERNTQIRKLPASIAFRLSQMLDGGEWREIMAMIPSDSLDVSSKPKYTVEHIHLVEAYGEKTSRSCTSILLDEWGTSGEHQPTVQTLFDVLQKAHFFRAADYLAKLMELPMPERPNFGPAAPVNTDLQDVIYTTQQSYALSVSSSDPEVENYNYQFLADITNNFNEEPMFGENLNGTRGHKIGAGAFGAVFYGVLRDGRAVAIKKLMRDGIGVRKQFKNEIKTLSLYKHDNLLPLLGYSHDTEDYCLVYEFMPNRSLQDRLAETKPSMLLNWRQRLNIGIGACLGIRYLHTARSEPLIHRDIKTANILLDGCLNARLGDFGLVKFSPKESRMTSTAFGTSAYMAPEALRGDVSVKMDVFSFGVVLLELLTGLTPWDDTPDGENIITYVQELDDDDKNSIEPLLDSKIEWNLRVGLDIYVVSKKCLNYIKKDRPFIPEVLKDLEHVLENVSEI